MPEINRHSTTPSRWPASKLDIETGEIKLISRQRFWQLINYDKYREQKNNLSKGEHTKELHNLANKRYRRTHKERLKMRNRVLWPQRAKRQNDRKRKALLTEVKT